MKAPLMRSLGSMAPRFVAGFDSSSAMVRSLALYLHGQDFPGLGGLMPPSDTLAALVNALPWKVRDIMYTISGAGEGLPASKLGDVDVGEISRWVTNSYPRRQYPAVMIGSASGALVHLAAALGIPWLPQTFLIPVRRSGVHPDEPRRDFDWGKQNAGPLLAANPDIQLHHMNDPNQDRLMIQQMTYFRFKRLTLGRIYEQFLEETLKPGGTIFLVECNRVWPTTRVDDRHVFQFGALGGATPDEFFHGSDRVETYLRKYDSHRRKWDPPEPDGERPEAEWGFEPRLRSDVERFARQKGYPIRRIVFEEPEHLSPLVADLYRWWYRQRNLHPNRLFVESFIVHEPFWTLRTGSAPFWLKFIMEPSADWIEQYLDSVEPFDDIYLTLFSHGVECVGLVPIERWRRILARAGRDGSFIGVDPDKYPRDFGVYARYRNDLRRIPARYPLPAPLALSQLETFLAEIGDQYPVRWIDQALVDSSVPRPNGVRQPLESHAYMAAGNLP